MAKKIVDVNYTDKMFWADMKKYVTSLPTNTEIRETAVLVKEIEINGERSKTWLLKKEITNSSKTTD